MNVNPLKTEFHSEGNFREQIAVLRLAEETGDHVILLRDFVQVCLPGLASFDFENPGHDSFEGWQEIDRMIEEDGVVGVFHTHPPGCSDFSRQDIMAQNGLAKANGSKLIWHGIQPCSGGGISWHGSRFCCVWMVNGRVFRNDYDFIDDALSSPVITLELPVSVTWNNGAYEV